MKVLLLLSLLVVAFALPEEYVCPKHSHYEECGTACPLSCDNYQDPPEACVLKCNPGCHCDKGYVRVKGDVEKCVKPINCPKLDEKNCDDKPDTGPCRANIRSYYYDRDSNLCKEFVYGGCQGNGNRYSTEEECEHECAI
ncbi:Kunitz-type serine protease inhibitor like protein [Argiope bruennichi]|uniref:Kunitz-type serine protease inhibitor like protein n=1 Tax=Argiope bruennichi TaxID=94029 RepID=A0A8T0DXR8_ARGBR|nr:Kunitz-type serine protease inhibitor like protein [Argiope bruennichi]